MLRSGVFGPVLCYLVRAVSPGEYAVPPPMLEDMYRPELTAVGDAVPGRLVVSGGAVGVKRVQDILWNAEKFDPLCKLERPGFLGLDRQIQFYVKVSEYKELKIYISL